MSSDNIIELQGVRKSFRSQVVLDGVDLKIRRGQTTVILGESGTGKSVLLKHIIGLLKPDEGKVLFEGREITNLPEKQLEQIRILFGFLFQGGALFDSMTAAANIAFPLREHTEFDEDKIADIVAHNLRLVGLGEMGEKMPAELSGGQKKRIALARAIAMEPKVILYDEPTTGLDPIRADVIDELIIKLKNQLNVTSIVVTHDMKSAYKLADRILMLYRGKFIFDGTTQEIIHSSNSRIQQFITGRAGDEELKALEVG